MKTERYIFRALRESSKIKEKWTHALGAVIVKGGTVLATGINNYDRGMHAEVAAILNCKTPLRGADMYVARHRRNQICGLAKPCPKCENLIRKVGISRVIFTTNDPKEPVQIMKIRKGDVNVR
jgi:pyrimidine deaminase RibD-like protein